MGDDRVYFHVHGLPQILKLKIAVDSPFHHLFDHIPTEKYQPPLCIDGPEFYWEDILLDPECCPADYRMDPGERHVQIIQVHFPLASPRRITAMRNHDDSARGTPRAGQSLTSPNRQVPANVAPTTPTEHITPRVEEPAPSGRKESEVPSVPSTQRSTAKSPAPTQPPPAPVQATPPPPPAPPVAPPAPEPAESARSNTQNTNMASAFNYDAGKIIDDLTQALRAAEDEIEDLQRQLDDAASADLAARLQDAEKRCRDLELDNDRLTRDLSRERKFSDDRQEALDVLRNKLTALERASSHTRSESNTAADAATVTLIESLRQHCHSLEAEVQNREEDIRQLNGKISELMDDKDKVRAKSEEISRLHDETKEKLDATRVALSRRGDEAVADMDTLRTRIDRLERENAMLSSDNQSLAQRVMTIENVKNELRAARNEHDIENAAWNATKNALEKEIKSMKERLADQQLQSQRHEKTLADRNAALLERIAFFEDPRNASQREDELKQREAELRARLRDTLAENERLKLLLKQAKQSCSELETSLFESNSVLIRVQKENMDLRRGTPTTPTAQSTPRSAPRRTDPFAGVVTSPSAGTNNNNASSAYAAGQGAATKEMNLLNMDPFALAKVDGRTSSSPHGLEGGTGSFRMGMVPSTRGSSPASFKDV